MMKRRAEAIALCLALALAGSWVILQQDVRLMQACIASQAKGAGQQEHSAGSEKGVGKVNLLGRSKKGEVAKMPIYDFEAKALDGSEIKFNKYQGDVLLIVNTASQCGYTPQYAGLEELNKKYAEKGLKILGFPCNQFGKQEPGDSSEIGSFCQRNYGVDFQMFEKIDVNGDHAHPLYRYLTGAANGAEGQPIKWNFTKFLVDRKGTVVKRYESSVKPEDMAGDIEKQL